MPLVEIDRLGIGDRDRIGCGPWKPGAYHWLRARSGFRRIREIAALVNYAHRFAGWSGRRIILSRLRHRTPANGWSRMLLVRDNSVGCFLAWPLVRRRCKYSDRIRGGGNPAWSIFFLSGF